LTVASPFLFAIKFAI